jgi:class 3 adenylate cyclase/predicted ATPase
LGAKARIKNRRTPGAAGSASTSVRTVMIADLSGSTPLGERLDPEELRTVLGGYFQTLSHEIHRFGGTIDKYIGDAVRATFDGDTEESTAVRAVLAGLSMLDALAKENEELERRYSVRLSLRVGVNTGEIPRHPGEAAPAHPDVGRTVRVAQRLESTATPNTVHVGGATYRAVRRGFTFEAAPLITIDAADDLERAYRVLGARVPTTAATVASTAQETTGASLQVDEQRAFVLEEQRKVVTVLFADLAAPIGGLDAETLRTVLGAYFSGVAAEIRRYGGTIDKYIGDAVMAVFGAPISHEDDAARAVHAALGIQTSIHRLNERLDREYHARLAVRVGVNTGEVVAGLLAGEVPAYTVTGDAVNTAQRIESATPPDEVLVGEETQVLARKSFAFEPVPPLTLKGKAQPIPAYRVSRPLEAAAAGGPPLVGRRAELDRLATLFREAETGRGVVAHLHGEPGVGKSRLLAEFLSTLQPGVRQTSARCSSYESASPYATLADLLRRLFSLHVADEEDVARRALEEAVRPLALPSYVSAIALLLEILGYGEQSALDPESKRRQLVVLLRLLLGQPSAGRIHVITIEDVHWMDPASSAMLGEVFARLAELSCVVITTSRDDAPPSWRAISIAVAPLDEGLASDLVDRVASAPLDEKTRTLVLERTAGNPFFIEEVVRSLGSRGAGAVPASVQELFEAKLDVLDESPKRTAQWAAVIGRTFWTRVLGRLVGDDSLRPALATLESGRFVAPYEITPEEKYAFRHALVQEVVYNTQLLARRRLAHGAVGGTIVELFGDRLDEFTDILAYHFGRSDDDQNARRFLLRAGQRAQHLYANDEALAYYERALARSGDDTNSRAAAYEGIGSVQRFQGRLGDAVASFQQALTALPPDDATGRARLRARIAAIHRLRGEREQALDLLSRTLADLPDDADREQTLLLLELGETHWYQGNFDAAVAALESATTHAERAGATDSLAEAYKHLGTVHTLKGEIPEGLRCYERSLALFESVEDPLAQSKVLNNIGSAYQRQARYPEALEALDRSLAIKQRLGDPLGIGAAENNLGQVHRLLGDLDRAETEYMDSLQQFELIGVATGIALAHSGLGSNALDRGDHARAREHFLLEVTEYERLGQRASLFEPERNIALTYVADDLDLALKWADRAVASAQAARVAEQEALALQVLGIVRTARGEIQDAVAALERSRELLPAGDRHELARTLVALAQAYLALAEDARRLEARVLLSEARAIFTELGAALDLKRLEQFGVAA